MDFIFWMRQKKNFVSIEQPLICKRDQKFVLLKKKREKRECDKYENFIAKRKGILYENLIFVQN